MADSIQNGNWEEMSKAAQTIASEGKVIGAGRVWHTCQCILQSYDVKSHASMVRYYTLLVELAIELRR